MSDILKNNLKEYLNKKITVFLKNDFRFKGELLRFDEEFVEIFDEVKNHRVLIKIQEITEVYLVNHLALKDEA